MAKATQDDVKGRKGAARLWIGWILGPLAWALHQNASFVMTNWVCATGNGWALHAVSFGALAIAAYGAIAAWHDRDGPARRRSDAAERWSARQHFMASGGLAICAISLVGILVESVPNFLLDACIRST